MSGCWRWRRYCSGFVLGNTGVMLAMLADVTPRKRLGMAVGIASAGFPIGSSIGPFVGGLIAQGPGIRALLGIDASFSVLMGLVLTLVVREEAHKMATGETVGRMLRAAVHAIVSSPVVLRLFILYFVAMYGYSLAAPFIPILLQHWYIGEPLQLAGMIGATLTLAGIAMAIMTPIWGRIGDTAGRWIVLPICLAGIMAGLLVASLAQSLFPLQLDIIGYGTLPGRHRHDGHRIAGAAGAGGAARAYPQFLAAALAALMVPRPDHWRGAGPCRADAALRRRRGRVGGGADIRLRAGLASARRCRGKRCGRVSDIGKLRADSAGYVRSRTDSVSSARCRNPSVS